MVLLVTWLAGWAAGEAASVYVLLTGMAAEKWPSTATFLTIWTLGGAMTVVALAWALAGREVVSVRNGMLMVRREAVGCGRSHEYALSKVTNLRVAAPPHPRLRQASHPFGPLTEGLIMFDYDGRLVRFGTGLDETSAAPIADAIKAHRDCGKNA